MKLRNWLRSVAWISLMACAAAACRKEASGPPNILLIVVDTLRFDRLGSYGDERGLTPFLDELAARGTIFRHAYAGSSWTSPSVSSLFTSRYPLQHGTNTSDSILDEQEITFAERFAAAGYWTGAAVGNFTVNKRRGFTQGFLDWYSVPPRGTKPRGAFLRQQALTLVQKACRPGGPPCLLYMQYMETHAPYEAPKALAAASSVEKAAAQAANDKLHGRQFELTDDDMRLLASLYDQEVAAVDAEIRTLFQELDEQGFLANAIVVLTADHGEEFHEHGGILHGFSLNEETIRVPLILIAPGYQGGQVVEQNVSLLDVAPTILDLAGLPPEPGFQGRSLVPRLRSSGIGAAVFGSGGDATEPDIVIQLPRSVTGGFDLRRHANGIVRGRLKLVETVDGNTTLYDLAADPGEMNPNPEQFAAERAAMEAALRAATTAQTADLKTRDKIPLDDKTKEQLRALGYTNF